MTKTQLELIASALRQSLPSLRYTNASHREQVVQQMQHKLTCLTLSAQLQRKLECFDREKFMHSCGYDYVYGVGYVIKRDLSVNKLEGVR